MKIFNENDNEGKSEDNNKSIIQIIQEILEEINQCNIYEANIGKYNNGNNEKINISEIKEIIEKLKISTLNKKKIINDLIPKIIESYNIIIKEEMENKEQTKYYEYQKEILINKKTTNEDLDKFITEYNMQKDSIISLKEQYKKIKEDFLLSKEKLSYNENIFINQIEKELINFMDIEKDEDKNEILNHS